MREWGVPPALVLRLHLGVCASVSVPKVGCLRGEEGAGHFPARYQPSSASTGHRVGAGGTVGLGNWDD